MYEREANMLLLIGFHGSGKSSLGKLLAQRTEWVHISFGDAFRRSCLERNIEPNRENAQLIMDEIFSQRGWRGVFEFCIGKRDCPAKIILDGFIDIDALKAAQKYYKNKCLVVLLDAPIGLCNERIINRQRGDDNHNENTNYPLKKVVEYARSNADIILDASLPLEQNYITIQELIL